MYDEGATLSVTIAIEIMSLREATTRELQESKTAAIDSVHSPTDQQKKNSWKACGYCSKVYPPAKRNCPAARARCCKCKKIGHFSIVCRSTRAAQANQVDVNPEKIQTPLNYLFIPPRLLVWLAPRDTQLIPLK